jgi:hypothetical protein
MPSRPRSAIELRNHPGAEKAMALFSSMELKSLIYRTSVRWYLRRENGWTPCTGCGHKTPEQAVDHAAEKILGRRLP